MIVVCTSCQARFRVADEKVGPRGVRVRCSKCRTVFAVSPPPPAEPVAAEVAEPASIPSPPPRAAHSLAPPLPAPPLSVPPPLPRRDDPFADPGLFEATPVAVRAGPAAVDPFAAYAAAAGSAASVPEPTPLTAPTMPSPAPPPRNGAAASLDDFLGSLPVTDLADLERTGARRLAAEAPGQAGADLGLALEERTPVGIPLEDRPGEGARAGDAGIPDPDPFPGLDSSSPAEALAAEQAAGHAGGHPGFADAYGQGFGEDFAGGEGFDSGLAVPAAAAAGAPGFDAPPFQPPPVLHGSPHRGPQRSAERGLQEGAPGVEVVPQAAGPGLRATGPAPTATRGRPVASAGSPRGEEPGPVESDVLGPGRLHVVLVNAVSLALLLFLTAGILLWWRGESALSLLRRVWSGPAGAIEVGRTTNGYYDTAAGRPLVFVRGEVRSLAAAPAGPVRVRAEMVRGGRVLASAEGRAGGVPTPEELASLGSRDDEQRLQAVLVSRAPAQVAPGEVLPFLVTFVDPPADLGDVTFRVAAEPAPRP